VVEEEGKEGGREGNSPKPSLGKLGGETPSTSLFEKEGGREGGGGMEGRKERERDFRVVALSFICLMALGIESQISLVLLTSLPPSLPPSLSRLWSYLTDERNLLASPSSASSRP